MGHQVDKKEYVLYMYSEVKTMLAIRLPKDIEDRLADLAQRTGRTKTYYARQAILAYLEDLEDIHRAELSLLKVREGKEQVYSLDEVEAELDLDD